MTARDLSIHTSNRLPVLLDHLARILATRPLPPFEPEIIVVQSQGMRRWLALGLAKKLGCAASLNMPFPGTFCHRLADDLAGTAAGKEPGTRDNGPALFSREALTWRILKLLEGGLEGAVFHPLAAYMEDGDQRKRYQLAARIADVLDDYQIFRPDLLLKWEKKGAGSKAPPHADWQAALWRLLCEEDDDHLARRFAAVIKDLEKREFAPVGLPSRVAVFGVSSLPPVFVTLLRALARFVPVSVYLVSPVREPRLVFPSREVDPDPAPGNPLLDSLWKQGREFISVLHRCMKYGARWEDLEFHDPGKDSCLHALQSDILNIVNRDARGDEKPHPLNEKDSSLRVHVCHSPLREMEVLRDQILDAFESDPGLRPHDVLVMVPDIETYGPYIQAVFGVEHEGTPPLPFRIADRSAGREEPLSETVLQVLRLARARLTGTEVMDLLETPAVRRSAGMTAADLDVLMNWVRDTHIRWGVDGEQKEKGFGLPALDANTWRAGIDRLLMGYGTGPVEALVAGTLPHGETTAGRADLLGRFATWLDTLFSRLDDLRASRLPEEWARDLNRVLDDLFEPEGEEEENGLGLVREHLAGLEEISRRVGFEGNLDLSVVREHLELALGDDSFGTGFISGRITFCALKPLRTIPFKVIAVAGLDDASFPRRDRPAAFDLQALEPREGDRSLREDDRQLFLETLLASRERLILSYVGRSRKNNKVRAPSVILSELLDALDRAFETAGGKPRDRIVVGHRLPPFSPEYFDGSKDSDPRLFSYSRANCNAWLATRGRRHGTLPFVSKPLPPYEEDLVLDLRDLIDCWINPSKYFCLHVLRLRLGMEGEELEEMEALEVDDLGAYKLKDWLMDRHIRGVRNTDLERAILAARGEFPPDRLGLAWHQRIEGEVASFLDDLGRQDFLEPLAVELSGEGWTLTGRIEGLTEKERLQFRPSSVKPKDKIRAWITHLALNSWALAHRGNVPCTTRLTGTNEKWVFSPVEEAHGLLTSLIAGTREAMSAPLPLFPQAGHDTMDLLCNKKRGDPVKAARFGWEGNEFTRGSGRHDIEDPYITLCFRGRDPLKDCREGFERWAEVLWKPLFEHGKKEKK